MWFDLPVIFPRQGRSFRSKPETFKVGVVPVCSPPKPSADKSSSAVPSLAGIFRRRAESLLVLGTFSLPISEIFTLHLNGGSKSVKIMSSTDMGVNISAKYFFRNEVFSILKQFLSGILFLVLRDSCLHYP